MIGRRTGALPGDVSYEQSLVDKGLDASLRKASADDYDKRVAPATEAPRHIGNCYTASVFFGLVSLVASTDLEGKRISDVLLRFWSRRVDVRAQGAFWQNSVELYTATVDLSARLSGASSGPRRTSRRRATRARRPTGRRRSSLVEVCRSRRARSFCGASMRSTGGSTGGRRSLIKSSSHCTHRRCRGLAAAPWRCMRRRSPVVVS